MGNLAKGSLPKKREEKMQCQDADLCRGGGHGAGVDNLCGRVGLSLKRFRPGSDGYKKMGEKKKNTNLLLLLKLVEK